MHQKGANSFTEVGQITKTTLYMKIITDILYVHKFMNVPSVLPTKQNYKR